MKTIQLDYKINRSAHPEWLLYFTADVRSFFAESGINDAELRLHRISERLNLQSFYHRKLKRSCECIKREIVGERLQVYNTTGTKIILEIYYQ